MIDILGEEVDVEETIRSCLHGSPVHSHEQFCIYQCTILPNDSIQQITVISQTKNEQGGEIDAHSWGHQFQLLTGDNGRHPKMTCPDIECL